MVEVFVWDFRGSSVAWGHASMHVGGDYISGNPTGGEYVSWWPQGNGRQPKFPSWAGPLHSIYSVNAISGRAFDDDVAPEDQGGEGQTPDHRIVLVGLDEEAIKTWWGKFKADGHHQWSTLSQNCSTTVAMALTAGGGAKFARHAGEGEKSWFSRITHDIGGWYNSWNTVWKPDDVLHYAQAIEAGLKNTH